MLGIVNPHPMTLPESRLMDQAEVSRVSRRFALSQIELRVPLAMVAIALLAAGCQSTARSTPAERATASLPASVPLVTTPRNWPDNKSYADPLSFVTRSFDLDLDVDFKTRQLRGSVTLELDRIDPSARELVLDTRDLQIQSVMTRPSAATLSARPASCWTVATTNSAARCASRCREMPRGSVSPTPRLPQASGLQWLRPRRPQASSSVPVQPGPGDPRAIDGAAAGHAVDPFDLHGDVARTRWSRRSDGRGRRPGQSPRTATFRFRMPQPIPSYLLALAVGDLEFRAIGPRTGVWAEPSLVDAAAWEFEDAEAMLDADPRRSTVRTAGVATTC